MMRRSQRTLTIPAVDNYALMDNVTWGFYDAVLREIGDRPIQVTYDRGRIEIMSPLPIHEKAKVLIRRMVDVISEEMDIPISGYASTTFRRKGVDSGLEPDECYYVQHAARVDKEEIDLDVDPPPDLAIEVDVTNRSIPREPVYAALRMPEIWRHDGMKLQALKLAAEGKSYSPIEFSLAFPFLRVGDLNQFLKMWPEKTEHQIIRAFREWVRQLKP
jgi:Uma2 family endonuclease